MKALIDVYHVDTSLARRFNFVMSKEYPSKIDRHEADEQINARREYITEFLKLERQSYCWVHLTDEQAIQLEQSENDPLMKNMSVPVERVLADAITKSY